MSYFGKNIKVEKKVVITYFGKKYVTAIGVVGMLADDAAGRIIDREREKRRRSGITKRKGGDRSRFFPDAKYGEASYNDLKALELWKQHKSRLRKKFIRRALPLIERLFA